VGARYLAALMALLFAYSRLPPRTTFPRSTKRWLAMYQAPHALVSGRRCTRSGAPGVASPALVAAVALAWGRGVGAAP
jgi:hypothetical protein